MRATLRWALVLSACGATACATGEEADNSGPPSRRSDASVTTDTGAVVDAPGTDSSVAIDTSPEPSDTGSAVTDTGGTATDTGTSVDSTIEDTAPIDTGAPDTGAPDTGTVTMDTAPTCSPSGEFGGSCKTNLDCAAITGCGYVCCAYDPSGTFSLGCGRISGGGLCLP